MAEPSDDRLGEVLSAVEQLGPAIKARALIEQAKALLMAEQGDDDQGAFNRLVATSQQQRMKLVHVAQQVRDRILAADGPPVSFADPDPSRDERADR